MKSRMKYFSLFLLVIVFAFSSTGCSNLSGPTDEDVIKAINENKYYKSGVGVFTLQAPVVILKKGSRNKDGSWPVKVKVIITHAVGRDQTSEPKELTPTFNMYKAKDNTGVTIWNAELVP